MRISMSSDGIGPLIIREKKEDIGSLLSRQESRKKENAGYSTGHGSAGNFLAIGFHFPVFDEFPSPVRHEINITKSFG